MPDITTLLKRRARESGVRLDILEKDYALSYLLTAIAEEPTLEKELVLKGGTALRKCYFPDHRFSEDLDFSTRSPGAIPNVGEKIFVAVQCMNQLLDQRGPFQAWEPLVPIEYDPAHIDRTLYAFGETVDKIENGEFDPPPLERLQQNVPGAWTHERFGTRVCCQCDARFSCASYRQYARGTPRLAERRMSYFTDDQPDQEIWRTAGLDTLS